LATIVIAVLLVGTAGFAVAEAAFAPHASQIPTVVAAGGQTRTTPAIPGAVTASVPAATATAAPAAKQTKAADSDDKDREVVKPSVRDDGD
jgi:hypothetical protein